MVEDLSMRGDRGCGQIASCQTSLLVANKVIEYISTRSMLEGRRQFLQPTASVNGEVKPNPARSATDRARVVFTTTLVDARFPTDRAARILEADVRKCE